MISNGRLIEIEQINVTIDAVLINNLSLLLFSFEYWEVYLITPLLIAPFEMVKTKYAEKMYIMDFFFIEKNNTKLITFNEYPFTIMVYFIISIINSGVMLVLLVVTDST